jgi:hypothetical protein
LESLGKLHLASRVHLIDRQGDVRYWWTGELNWNGAQGDRWMRQRIEQLIAEKD